MEIKNAGPTDDGHFITKSYVDEQINTMDWQEPKTHWEFRHIKNPTEGMAFWVEEFENSLIYHEGKWNLTMQRTRSMESKIVICPSCGEMDIKIYDGKYCTICTVYRLDRDEIPKKNLAVYMTDSHIEVRIAAVNSYRRQR